MHLGSIVHARAHATQQKSQKVSTKTNVTKKKPGKVAPLNIDLVLGTRYPEADDMTQQEKAYRCSKGLGV